jgi:hypothetical protein
MEIVDEKVEKLFETYKALDELNLKKVEMGIDDSESA